MSHYLPTLVTGFAALLLWSSPAFAQTTDECEKLKNDNAKLKFENANLKRGIIAHSSASAPAQTTERPAAPATTGSSRQKQTVDKVEYELVKCEGNSKSQTVAVTYLLTNRAASHNINGHVLKAVDDLGEAYQAFGVKIGTGSNSILTTDVPIKAVATVSKVTPKTKTFKVITWTVYNSGDSPYMDVEFRNVAINWR